MTLRGLVICLCIVFLGAFFVNASFTSCLAASNERHQEVDFEDIFSVQGAESGVDADSAHLKGIETAVSAAVLFVCLVITATCGRQLNRLIEKKKSAKAAMSKELNEKMKQAVRVDTSEYEQMLNELSALDAQENQLKSMLEELEVKEESVS